MKKKLKKLRPEVARKYILGTHHTRLILSSGLEIDLCQLTLEEANKYVAEGNFPYLVRKPKPSSTKKI